MPPPPAADHIRQAVAQVQALRRQALEEPALGQALQAVKTLQAQRFRGTYRDLLERPDMGAAARFFLSELYGTRDFSQRDQQFSRIAGTLEKVFPNAVVATATQLAQLHAASEALDADMARHWRANDAPDAATRYVNCWRAVGQSEQRHWQVAAVLQLGTDLDRLTRKPGLRTLLRMMRGPAQAAGLADLQAFLEAGFDTFGDMARSPAGAGEFLATIAERERALIQRLFEGDASAAASVLGRALVNAR